MTQETATFSRSGPLWSPPDVAVDVLEHLGVTRTDLEEHAAWLRWDS